MLVDMPGYGFGSRPEWGDLILSYWRDREQYVHTLTAATRRAPT